MKLGIDIDGVLARFDLAFWRVLENIHGPRKFSEPTRWDWSDTGWDETEVDCAWSEISSTTDFWLYLEPYVNNVKALSQFMHSNALIHDYYFITSRTPTLGLTTLVQTQLWLRDKNLLGLGMSVVVADKPSHKARIAKGIGLDAAIDDKLETVIEGNKETRWTLLDRPWNRQGRPDGIHVVGSVEEWLNGLDTKS